ncbi:HAD hydrolase-like protein [Bacillus cereus]|uniref:HAD hydrolase-like protein n=1 Tax=Bacillus cereus TaxID=1396 RepID=UPI000992AF5E|nr:HAD hydrolase-like protein [Bacillus cereus]MBJ7986594.1 HAD hydrolase-like protein [Bacillus cereus]OOQ94926.1 phosphoglycolate phosphatase [Bacillus cereus]
MYTTFLFDLDGTLTDPKEGIINSVLYALEKIGIEEVNISELDSFIGPPILLENKVYDGIPTLLQELKDAGNRLFVATSKPTVFAKQVIEHFQLTSFFEEIVGSNLDGTRIKKEEIIAHILQTNEELQKEEMVMIGDRKHDVIGANSNGIASIGVLYGYGNENELSDAGASHIVKDVEELQSFCIENSTIKL